MNALICYKNGIFLTVTHTTGCMNNKICSNRKASCHPIQKPFKNTGSRNTHSHEHIILVIFWIERDHQCLEENKQTPCGALLTCCIAHISNDSTDWILSSVECVCEAIYICFILQCFYKVCRFLPAHSGQECWTHAVHQGADTLCRGHLGKMMINGYQMWQHWIAVFHVLSFISVSILPTQDDRGSTFKVCYTVWKGWIVCLPTRHVAQRLWGI